MDFDAASQSPLDNTRDADSSYLQIVEKNGYVESTVPNDVALSGGGKSKGGWVYKSRAIYAFAVEAIRAEMKLLMRLLLRS